MASTPVGLATAHTIDLSDTSVLAPPPPAVQPVGRRGQLQALRAQLEWCTHAVAVAQRQADTTMRDADAEESARWGAVRRLRSLSWKVCREVLPMVSRVPPALREHPEFREVERAAFALRRQTEDALRDNANYTVDLANAMAAPLLGRRT